MNGNHEDHIKQRAVESAIYIIENNATIRQTAKRMGVSKSTTHKDFVERLPYINIGLYAKVNKILEINSNEKHIRGGVATRRNYKNMRKVE